MKACREEANVEAEKDRELLTGLLRIWRSIKDLRHSSRVHATSIRLLIRREELDHAEEEEQRKRELEEEVREVLEERQQEYEAQSKRYEKEMAEWRIEHKKRVSRGKKGGEKWLGKVEQEEEEEKERFIGFTCLREFAVYYHLPCVFYPVTCPATPHCCPNCVPILQPQPQPCYYHYFCCHYFHLYLLFISEVSVSC